MEDVYFVIISGVSPPTSLVSPLFSFDFSLPENLLASLFLGVLLCFATCNVWLVQLKAKGAQWNTGEILFCVAVCLHTTGALIFTSAKQTW